MNVNVRARLPARADTIALEATMIEDFGRFGTAKRSSYLRTRARVRAAIAGNGELLAEEDDRAELPQRPTQEELEGAARNLRFGTFSEPMMAGKRLGVDPVAIATAFARKIQELEGQLWDLLDSPLGRIAAKIELRAEVGLAVIAASTLNSILGSEDGLECRCDDLRHELEELESLLVSSGEVDAMPD